MCVIVTFLKSKDLNFKQSLLLDEGVKLKCNNGVLILRCIDSKVTLRCCFLKVRNK